jgi:hypothetical protein
VPYPARFALLQGACLPLLAVWTAGLEFPGPSTAFLAHREQKVHSKEQIVASLESIGKLASQRSQVLFISNIRSGSNRLDIVLTKLSI